MDFAYSIAGFAVGTIVGLTGVGGGSLMTPLLVLLFNVHPSVAVGTDLLYASITKAGGTLVHGFKGSVDWRITGLLASGSLPGAALTLFLVSRYAPGGIAGASSVISFSLGIALFLTAAALIFRARIQQYAGKHNPDAPNSQKIALLTILTGIVLGALVSISSVGAGALGVTVLFFLYPRLPALRIVATDIAHAVPLTLVAGLGHWWLGSVNWHLLGSLLIGSLPGIWIGSHISSRLPDKILRPTLAAMLVLVGAKLVIH